MKLRVLVALACAMILSMSAASMVLAGSPKGTPAATDCGQTEQGTPIACPSEQPTATASGSHHQCGCPTPSASASDEESSSPTDSATPSASASDEESSSPSDEATPSDGGVDAATGTPTITLPPTDSLSGGSGNGSGGVPIAVLAMAGLLAAVLLMTPATAGLRRGKRRS